MSGRLLPAALAANIALRWVGRHQDVVHRHPQQGTQGVKIVHRRQTLAPLPFVDGLGLLEAEKPLKVPDGQALRLSQPADVGPGGRQVDDRERAPVYGNRLPSGLVK